MIFGLVNVVSVWCVCISTAATELDIKYFCPMKYFCILSPWCSFSANLVRSISPHRMHFRFWFKRYVIASILPAKMRPRTNIFHAKKAKSHNSFALPLCTLFSILSWILDVYIGFTYTFDISWKWKGKVTEIESDIIRYFL